MGKIFFGLFSSLGLQLTLKPQFYLLLDTHYEQVPYMKDY